MRRTFVGPTLFVCCLLDGSFVFLSICTPPPPPAIPPPPPCPCPGREGLVFQLLDGVLLLLVPVCSRGHPRGACEE